MKKPIGTQLKDLREQFGIKQFEVSDRLKIDQTKLSMIERGRRVPDPIYANQIRNVIYEIAKERLANLPEAV